MNNCKHDILTLVPIKNNKLRCKHCHLTISEDELGKGCCPECLHVHHVERRNFEKISTGDRETVRYCCELCGAVIEC